MRKCIEEIQKLFYARTECIWIRSYEEEIVVKDIRELLMEDEKLCGMSLILWSNTEGVSKIPLNSYEKISADKKISEIPALFKFISDTYERHEHTIFILRDLDKLIKDSKTIRYIRDWKEKSSVGIYMPFVVLSPSCEIPVELNRLFRVVDYDLPDKEEILEIVSEANEKLKAAKETKSAEYIPIDEENLKTVVAACQGLTAKEIISSLNECIVKNKTLDLTFLSENKIQTVKKTGVLDYKIPKITLDDVGGNGILKEWLLEVKESFTPEAKEFGIDKPKGMMSVGIAGCGKTMMAEAFAGLLKYPLLSLSLSKIMNRLVGESEKRIEAALDIVKSCAPCVMLIDECEKLLGGVTSSNNVDGGITARIFQSLLKFMQDNEDVFIMMTSNDVSQLPPEFLRSGRIDAIWYFGLPTNEEREELLKIHFQKRNKTVSQIILNTAINLSENFTGAEVEQLVKNSLRSAFMRSRQDNNINILKSDIIKAAKEITPVFKNSREKILALENYCSGRARRTNEIVEDGEERFTRNIFTHSLEL